MSIIEHRINSDYLLELSRFADSDKDVANCRQKLHQEVFRHEWFVALFKEDAPFFKLPFFNKPFFKKQLQLFYLKAHDFLTRFGFVGYYHYKDIGAWIDYVSKRRKTIRRRRRRQIEIEEEEEYASYSDYSESESDDDLEPHEKELEENILETFPFGIIPVGMTQSQRYGQYVLIENRETLRETILFQCFDLSLAARFDFHVIDRGATFVPMGPYILEHGIKVCMMVNDLVPTSQFADLYNQKQLIREATKTLFDANSMHVYPESFLIDRPQKDAPMDEIADDTLYSLDNILNTRQHDNIQREAMGMDNARYHAQRIAMKRTIGTQCASRSRCGSSAQQMRQASSVIWDEKQEHNRPSIYETIQVIPRSVEIVGGKTGSPVVNVTERVAKYERDVCKAMNVPYSFVNPDTTEHAKSTNNETSKKRISTTNIQSERNQKLLEKEVQDQHSLFDEIFTEVYQHTFGLIDEEIFNYHPNHISLYIDLEPGIHFEYIPVKSEAALSNLLQFHELGIVPFEEMQRVVYNEFNLQLPNNELTARYPTKRRKLEDTPKMILQ